MGKKKKKLLWILVTLLVVIVAAVWGAILWVNGGSEDMKEPGEAVVQRDAPATADDVATALQQDMEAGADVFYGRISSVIERMLELGGEDLAAAKDYQSQAVAFIEANRPAIDSLARENAEIGGLVESITDSLFFVNIGLETQ